MKSEQEGMVSTTQMAKITGMSPATIKLWCLRGIIPEAKKLQSVRQDRKVWLIPEHVANDPRWSKYKPRADIGASEKYQPDKRYSEKYQPSGLSLVVKLSAFDVDRLICSVLMPNIPAASLDEIRIIIEK